MEKSDLILALSALVPRYNQRQGYDAHHHGQMLAVRTEQEVLVDVLEALTDRRRTEESEALEIARLRAQLNQLQAEMKAVAEFETTLAATDEIARLRAEMSEALYSSDRLMEWLQDIPTWCVRSESAQLEWSPYEAPE